MDLSRSFSNLVFRTPTEQAELTYSIDFHFFNGALLASILVRVLGTKEPLAGHKHLRADGDPAVWRTPTEGLDLMQPSNVVVGTTSDDASDCERSEMKISPTAVVTRTRVTAS